jgi:hypothetical protein
MDEPRMVCHSLLLKSIIDRTPVCALPRHSGTEWTESTKSIQSCGSLLGRAAFAGTQHRVFIVCAGLGQYEQQGTDPITFDRVRFC